MEAEIVNLKITALRAEVLRLVGRDGSLHSEDGGRTWVAWDRRGGPGLPGRSPASITRTVRTLTDAGLLTGVDYLGALWAEPTAAGRRAMREPRPERVVDTRTGAVVHDSFRGGAGLCYVRTDPAFPGMVHVGTGLGAPLSEGEARRLAFAILDAVGTD